MIKMCEDCRVIVVTESSTPTPRRRAGAPTEDYLRERGAARSRQ